MNIHKEMAQMAHAGATDQEIAAKLDLTSIEMAAEWSRLTDSADGVPRADAVNLIIAQLILEARRALAERKSELALIIRAPQDLAVLTFNMMGIVTGISQFSESLLGIPAQGLIGMPIDAILAGRLDQTKQSEKEMAQAEQGDFVRVNRTHTRQDGSTFEAEHSLVAIYGRMGEVTGFVREIRDLTNRRVHEVKIDELNASLALLVQE